MAASPFLPKAAAWLRGREGLLDVIREKRAKLPVQVIWMHCASLGEFEQGRPLLEALRTALPGYGLVLTFFSPSGFDVRKNYPGADAVWYLPADTRQRSGEFLAILKPSAGIFVKYDLWLNLLHQAAMNHIPLYLVAALFRPDQVFFRPWGNWHRNGLRCFRRIWCQDQDSAALIGPVLLSKHPDMQSPDVAIAPDTRFDRVLQIAASPEIPDHIQQFAAGRSVLVAGSTWAADENLLADLAEKELIPNGWALLIAPHEIHESAIVRLAGRLPGRVLRHSAWAEENISSASLEDPAAADCLIVDKIGLLSALYSTGKAAYIGGGFGAGIHNTLEAAVYGLPLAFGPRYAKFREAKDLIEIGAATAVRSPAELIAWFRQLGAAGVAGAGGAAGNVAGEKAAAYVRAGAGGAAGILRAIVEDLTGDAQR